MIHVDLSLASIHKDPSTVHPTARWLCIRGGSLVLSGKKHTLFSKFWIIVKGDRLSALFPYYALPYARPDSRPLFMYCCCRNCSQSVTGAFRRSCCVCDVSPVHGRGLCDEPASTLSCLTWIQPSDLCHCHPLLDRCARNLVPLSPFFLGCVPYGDFHCIEYDVSQSDLYGLEPDVYVRRDACIAFLWSPPCPCLDACHICLMPQAMLLALESQMCCAKSACETSVCQTSVCQCQLYPGMLRQAHEMCCPLEPDLSAISTGPIGASLCVLFTLRTTRGGMHRPNHNPPRDDDGRWEAVMQSLGELIEASEHLADVANILHERLARWIDPHGPLLADRARPNPHAHQREGQQAARRARSRSPLREPPQEEVYLPHPPALDDAEDEDLADNDAQDDADQEDPEQELWDPPFIVGLPNWLS